MYKPKEWTECTNLKNGQNVLTLPGQWIQMVWSGQWDLA